MAPRHRRLDPIDIALDCREVRFGAALAGEAHDHLGQQNARLGEIAHRNPAEVEHALERLRHRRAGLEHESSALRAVAQLDQARDLERPQRLTHRRTADAELFCQVALGRQLFAGTDFAKRKLPTNLFANLLEQARAPNGSKADAG